MACCVEAVHALALYLSVKVKRMHRGRQLGQARVRETERERRSRQSLVSSPNE